MKNVQEDKDLKKQTGAPGDDKRAMRARQQAIGRELRRYYDSVAEEPIPEDFLELLQQIDSRKPNSGEDNTSS